MLQETPCHTVWLAELGGNGPNTGLRLLSLSGEMSQRRPAAGVSTFQLFLTQASNVKYSSWKAVYSAITSNVELEVDHRAVIESFLSDPEVLRLLEHPFDAHPQPTTQSKAAFETKTSAINVTPSSSAKYDIKEIKEDSLWLSKVAKIDEVSALRLVTEECQSRNSAQLLGQFSEEELVSIRDAAGSSQYSSSIPVSLLVQGLDPDAIQQQFSRQDTRRQRLLRIYFSQRRYLLKCTERLVDAIFSNRHNTEQDGTGKDKGKSVELETSWQVTCGLALVSRWDLDNLEPIILRCIRAVSTNLNNLDEGSGWSDEDGGRGDIEIDWVRNQFTEATHAMELLCQFLANSTGLPSGQTLLEWFRLQRSCGFFSNFESVRSRLSSPKRKLLIDVHRMSHLFRPRSSISNQLILLYRWVF
jgi:nuclear pore complex protein Nup188